MKASTRMVIAELALVPSFGYAILSIWFDILGPFKTRIFIPLMMLSIVVITFFRRWLKPSFPEMSDSVNPLWERILVFSSVLVLFITVISLPSWHGSILLIILPVSTLFLCSFDSDLRFVRKQRKQERTIASEQQPLAKSSIDS
jgi:hypothetical protein